MTLDEGVRAFLTHLKAERGLAKNTQTSYRRDLEHLTAYLEDEGCVDVADISEELVLAVVDILPATALTSRVNLPGGRHACRRDDHAKAILTGSHAKILCLFGGTVCRKNMYLMRHSVFRQCIDRFFYYGKIAIASHDNRYFFHVIILLNKTKLGRPIPHG